MPHGSKTSGKPPEWEGQFPVGPPCLGHCLLSHACRRPLGTCRTCSQSTATSPWVLCKRLARAVGVRSCAARPNTQPFHKGPQKLHLPSVALEGRGGCRPSLPQPETWATVTYAPGRKRAPRNSPHDTEAQTRQSAVFKRKIYLTSFT